MWFPLKKSFHRFIFYDIFLWFFGLLLFTICWFFNFERRGDLTKIVNYITLITPKLNDGKMEAVPRQHNITPPFGIALDAPFPWQHSWWETLYVLPPQHWRNPSEWKILFRQHISLPMLYKSILLKQKQSCIFLTDGNKLIKLSYTSMLCKDARFFIWSKQWPLLS